MTHTHWTAATLFASVLIVSCADRAAENTPNSAEPALQPAVDVVPTDETLGQPTLPVQGDASAVQQTPPRADGQVPKVGRRSVSPASTPSSAPAARAASRTAEWREVTAPSGTALSLELMTEVASDTAQVEAPVRARLRQPVAVDGRTVLPAGAVLTGHVTDVERAGRVKGRARVAFRFDEVQVRGAREDLRTNPLVFEAEPSKGEDAAKIGGGAVGGAIIGGILGGGDGAAKGAAIGGAAGTGVVLATRGTEVRLASGADLAATLAQPFTVRVDGR